MAGLSVAWLVCCCSAARLAAAEIHVFAAASLSESLAEIAVGYEKQTGDKVFFNFGASSFLARQIEGGAPADLFFSADEARMDTLEKSALIDKSTRKSRLSNSLVIVTATDSAVAIKSGKDLTLPEVRRIALADPQAVPAGIYAREYLVKAKLWTAVEPKVIPTDNVRAALAAVESGNVEVGIVYKTDAAMSKKVKVVYEVASEESPIISYSMAVLKEAKQGEAARRFWKFLNSTEASRIFQKFGFIVRD